MNWGILTPEEFKEFELRRDILKTKGIVLDYTAEPVKWGSVVEGEPVESGFKLVLNQKYNLDELDTLTEGVVI